MTAVLNGAIVLLKKQCLAFLTRLCYAAASAHLGYSKIWGYFIAKCYTARTLGWLYYRLPVVGINVIIIILNSLSRNAIKGRTTEHLNKTTGLNITQRLIIFSGRQQQATQPPITTLQQ